MASLLLRVTPSKKLFTVVDAASTPTSAALSALMRARAEKCLLLVALELKSLPRRVRQRVCVESCEVFEAS